jgi:hypothetical protein
MEPNILLNGGRLAILHKLAPMAEMRVAEPNISVPERGTTGPIPIGQVMEPIRRIIAHPDRNRLMAEFFKRYW